MRTTWDRIEAWLRANAPRVYDSLRRGATDARIAGTEEFLGSTFPEPVRESYRLHDGQTPDGPWLIEGWEFLSLERIRDEWKVWKDLLDGGDFEGIASDPDEGIRSDWWNARWIPLTYDGSGNHHCLDLDPAPGGDMGQVIKMWHDESSRPLVARSYREWLDGFADDLEAGLYVYSEDYLGLIARDDIKDE